MVTRSWWVLKDSRRGVSLLAVVVLSCISAAVFSRVYEGATLLGLSLGAAAIPVLLSVFLRGRPFPLSIALSLLLFLAYAVFSVWITADAAEQAAPLSQTLLDAIRNSGARILTSSIPIVPSPATVLLPVALVWVVALAAAETVARTKAFAVAFVIPLAIYVAALVLVGPNAAPFVGAAVAYAGVSAVALFFTGGTDVSSRLRHVPRTARRHLTFRRGVVAVVGVSLLVVATAWAGSSIIRFSDARPADPRSNVDPPVKNIEGANPLERLAYWAQNPASVLFSVETNKPSRISWVTLTDYDGITWTPGRGDYRITGSALPVMEVPSRHVEVRQKFLINDLKGYWLPAVDRARTLTGVRASYDAESATLLLSEGLTHGLSYDVVSQYPDLSYRDLAYAGISQNHAAYKRMERYPVELGQMASEITKSGRSAYEKALLLERFLRDNYHFTPDAPSGHSYAHLKFFLTKALEEGGHRGTSEQFATAFASMARFLQLPSRVVVGFHAGTEVGDGNYVVHAGDAFAWPEIYFDNVGWVAFNPTPTPSDVPPPLEEDTAEAKENAKEKADKLEDIDNPDDSEADPAKESGSDSDRAFMLLWIVGGGGVGLAVFVIVIPFARFIRRRRHRKGEPASRVIGAWRELDDSLRLARHRPPSSAPALDVATFAEGLPHKKNRPHPVLKDLAIAVNAVSFAPASSQTGKHVARLVMPAVSSTDAETAIGTSRAFTKSLIASQPWWRRVLWHFDPRPLWW